MHWLARVVHRQSTIARLERIGVQLDDWWVNARDDELVELAHCSGCRRLVPTPGLDRDNGRCSFCLRDGR